MSTRDTEELNRDRRYMRSHMLWPNMMLPLIRRNTNGDGRSCAYMIGYEEGK